MARRVIPTRALGRLLKHCSEQLGLPAKSAELEVDMLYAIDREGKWQLLADVDFALVDIKVPMIPGGEAGGGGGAEGEFDAIVHTKLKVVYG